MQLDPRFTEGQRKRLENQRAARESRTDEPEILPPLQVRPCRFIKRGFDEVVLPNGERVKLELQ